MEMKKQIGRRPADLDCISKYTLKKLNLHEDQSKMELKPAL